MSAPDLTVRLGSVSLRHPIVNASGTWDPLETAAPAEARDCAFAAYFPKTVTVEPRAGNVPPRVTETPSGMVNAIGLANPGCAAFLESLPMLQHLECPVFVSVGGSRPEDYVQVVCSIEEWLRNATTGPDVAGYELNVSCPNVEQGGSAIGADALATGDLVRQVRQVTRRLVILKLTPNVTDVAAPALAAVQAGADALSLVNTFKALVLDQATLRPFLGNRTGGLSGPAVKPLALRMVAEVAAAVDVPLIGLGGVVSGRDALEFIACGASAVGVGTALFADPQAPQRIVAELRHELAQRGLAGLDEVRGIALRSS